MKCFLLISLLLPVTLIAQKIALIDRGFKRPILFTDSVTTEHVVENYFPVHSEDLRSVVKLVDQFINVIEAGERPAIENNVSAGRSTFLYTASVVRKHNFHRIILSTRTNAISTSIKLVHFDDSRKRAVQKLLIFTDYVKNNLAGADEAMRAY